MQTDKNTTATPQITDSASKAKAAHTETKAASATKPATKTPTAHCLAQSTARGSKVATRAKTASALQPAAPVQTAEPAAKGSTKPAPLFTNKSLWSLIWPLFIEQLLAITLGIADTIMVSSLGEEAVSGVSLVDTLQILLNSVFAALATGGAVVCSQYIGARNKEKASSAAKQLIYAVIVSAAVLMAIGLPLNSFILKTVFGTISAGVFENARLYFMLMLLGLPSIALYNACAALFRAQGNSRISMYISVLVNIINIGGNALMIYGLKCGVEGVAIPTLTARTAAAVVLLVLLYRCESSHKENVISIRGLMQFRIDWKAIVKILSIGVPNGLENGMFQIGKILVLSLIAGFGTSAIAANAAANVVSSFEVLPGSAIGLAILTVAGQCRGANRNDEVLRFTWKLTAWAYAALIAINIPIVLFAPTVVGIFNLSKETSALAVNMFVLHGIFTMLWWALSFAFPNALRAVNDAKFTMIVSMLSMWIVRVGLSYFLAYYAGVGALCSWIAMPVDWLVRSVAFVVRFQRRAWQKKSLI